MMIISLSLPIYFRHEKLHIFCKSFMWFLDGCIILYMHSLSLFSFVLIAVKKREQLCETQVLMLTSCEP